MSPPGYGFGAARITKRRPGTPATPAVYTPTSTTPGLPAQPSRFAS